MISNFSSKRILALLVLSMMLSSAATLFAQSAGFGSITGVVEDSSGAVVPGAKVIVDNPAKGIHRELETTGAGVFNAPALVPASGYIVTVSKESFSKYEAKDLTVNVGESINLNPVLRVAGAGTSVEVTTQAPLVDQTKTDTSQVVDARQIQDLPINGRRVDSFVLLTPGVTSDGAFGLISFRGNPGGNSFLTDGNDTTNSFYDENAGRTRTYNIAQDAVQEFQVVSSNFLAEYGHASGGVVNTVTRSGSNNIHGTAYEFFRNRTLGAIDPTSHGVNPPEWRHQAGLSIGGPVVKDKVFYFFNGELTRRSNPAVSSNLTNNTMFDSSGNFLVTNPQTKAANCPTGAAGNPTAAQCTAAIAYLQSRVATQLIPRTVDDNLLFGKIDYHLNDRNTFSFSANYLDFRSPNGIQTQLSLTDGNAIGNNADTNVFDRTGRASWTFLVSPNAVNEFRFGYFKDRQFDPASPSLLPSFGPAVLAVQSVSNVGFANQYPRLDPSEQRYQLADTYSWSIGKHSFKFGFDWDHNEDFVSRIVNVNGSYTYATLSAFALDFSGNATGAKNWQRFQQSFGNPVVDVNMSEVSWFVQDQWRLTPKLTLTPGLRYEHAFVPQPPQANPAFPLTGQIPSTSLDFAPRLGIAYALTPKTALRAGFGLFYNRYVTSAIENLFLSNGLYQSAFTLNSGTAAQKAAGPVFPTALAAAPNVAGSSALLFADPNTYRNPYSEQLDVAIEREIAKDTVMTVSYVWSRGLHLETTLDTNANAPTTSFTYPILDASGNQVSTYTTPIYTSRPNPAFGTIAELQSSGNSYYNALLVNVNHRYTSWFEGDVAYTYSHAIDYAQGGGNNTLFGSAFPTSYNNGDYRGDKGSSSIDRRHNLVVNGVVSPTFSHGDGMLARYLVNNWQLSAVEVAASSQPLTPTISVSNGAPGSLSTFSINGLGGSTRVPFESISALDVGPLYRTDARITKMVPIGERFKVNLGFEAFNIFNHLIVQGSSPRVTQQFTAIKQTSGPLNGQIALVPNPQFGNIQQTQFPPDGTTARRAQAYVRILW